MYILSKEQEASGKWKVRATVSSSETIFLWFEIEPQEADVEAVINRYIANQLLSNPEVEVTQLSCNAWQLRTALTQLGWRASVEYLVANSGDQVIQDGWEYAAEFHRYNSFIVQAGAALGKTDEEMDNLFTLAQSILNE